MYPSSPYCKQAMYHAPYTHPGTQYCQAVFALTAGCPLVIQHVKLELVAIGPGGILAEHLLRVKICLPRLSVTVQQYRPKF